EGAMSSALDVGDDARDHRCLIVGSDDNPYLRRLRRHRSSRNEGKPTQNQHDADHSRIDNGSAIKRWRFEQQLAASRGRCIGLERGNLAQRKTIAHRLGFRSSTRMASNKLTGSLSGVDISMRLALRPDMRVS